MKMKKLGHHHTFHAINSMIKRPTITISILIALLTFADPSSAFTVQNSTLIESGDMIDMNVGDYQSFV